MAKWIIKDADGNITNPAIKGTEDWVKANFEHYEELPPSTQNPPSKEWEERRWRNAELHNTDVLVLLPDHPDKDNLTAYRQALRDWPSTGDFPDTRPTLGS